jgi:hypothetical protein
VRYVKKDERKKDQVKDNQPVLENGQFGCTSQ